MTEHDLKGRQMIIHELSRYPHGVDTLRVTIGYGWLRQVIASERK